MQDNSTKTSKTSIVCRVKKVVFHNKENGYSVLSVISDAEDTPFSICGILNGMPEGSVLHCQGEWKDHIMYGRQFIVDSWEEGKTEEVEKLFSIQSRANSRPVYRTWGEMLKHNPDIEAKAKYVTEVFITEVERDFDYVDYSCGTCEVPFTAQVKAIYYAVYNDQKISLIICTFSVCGNCTAYLEDEDTYEIEEMEGCVDLPAMTRRYSCFVGIEDIDGLRDLDFHASGVPTCEEELKQMHYEGYWEEIDDLDEMDDSDDIEDNDDSDEIVDYDEMGDYTIDEMKSDLESALEDALLGIEYDSVMYECTKRFSRNKISGEFF